MQLELELLAPAKNKSIGITAIDCGADALYIAGPKYGAREGAGNSISDIQELVTYAHKFGAKVYMVINTIIYSHELEEVEKSIWDAYRVGCDAIIIQDLAILKMHIPPIPLFASTQTNIRTPEQAKLLDSFNFKRLILARELSLKQIKEIKSVVKADIETFVHGALCVSYSGQCYLSQKLTGRSANRGSCAQACRSNYSLIDEDGKTLVANSPLLSLKDFNLSNRVGELVEAGVTSFKIEGRLKNESYIKNVVLLYRRKLDEFIAKNKEYKKASWGNIEGGFKTNAKATFNRGYTELYINGQRGEWRSQDGAKYLGEYIGKVVQSSKTKNGLVSFTYKLDKNSEPSSSANNTNKNIAEIISNGDGLCFITPKGEIIGARANSCNGLNVNTLEKSIIPSNSKIFRNYNIAFEKELERNMPQLAIPTSLAFTREESSCYIKVSCLDGKISFNYNITQQTEEASNQELALKNISTQLAKKAEHFSFNFCGFNGESVPFYTISTLNSIRREIAQILSEKLEEQRVKEKESTAKNISEKSNNHIHSTTATYLANIANPISKEVYKELGYKKIDDAYELAPTPQAELMRTKYCIKHELGLCHKQGVSYNKRLFLVNGKNKLELKFQCSLCEMLVIG